MYAAIRTQHYTYKLSPTLYVWGGGGSMDPGVHVLSSPRPRSQRFQLSTLKPGGVLPQNTYKHINISHQFQFDIGHLKH